MIAVVPFNLNASGVLVSTNAVDWLAYNSATTYAAYVEATGYTTTTACSYLGRNWISLQAANTAHTPGATGSELWWRDAGVVNSLAAFDDSVQTATTSTGGLEFTLKLSSRVTSVALMGVIGTTASLVVRTGPGGDIIDTRTQLMQSSDGTPFGYCFEELFQISDVYWYDLYSSPDAHLTITIEGTGTTACGLCVVGKQFYLGEAILGFSMPFGMRGKQYLDENDNPVRIGNGSTKNCTGTIKTEPAMYNRVMAFYAKNLGVPLFWMAAPGIADRVSASGYGSITRVVPSITEGEDTTDLEISGNR